SRMRFFVLLFALVFFMTTAVNCADFMFNEPPKGGLCHTTAGGDCRRCECPKGRMCKKGTCV
ncbi:hypothetical protein PENTCL1PPCAC_28688, partial [Pristionchus entomophagus]